MICNFSIFIFPFIVFLVFYSTINCASLARLYDVLLTAIRPSHSAKRHVIMRNILHIHTFVRIIPLPRAKRRRTQHAICHCATPARRSHTLTLGKLHIMHNDMYITLCARSFSLHPRITTAPRNLGDPFREKEGAPIAKPPVGYYSICTLQMCVTISPGCRKGPPAALGQRSRATLTFLGAPPKPK